MKPGDWVRRPMHSQCDVPTGTYLVCIKAHPAGDYTIGKVYKVVPSNPKFRMRTNQVRIRDNKREKTDFNFSEISDNYLWDYFRLT
jgi:hypothetical protein